MYYFEMFILKHTGNIINVGCVSVYSTRHYTTSCNTTYIKRVANTVDFILFFNTQESIIDDIMSRNGKKNNKN